MTERGPGVTRAIWSKRLRKIKGRARALLPGLQKLIDGIDPERSGTRAKLQVPLLIEPTQQRKMGGSDWCDQFASGFPMMGELGEPGEFPPSSEFSGILTREGLSKSASSRFVAAKKGQGPR